MDAWASGAFGGDGEGEIAALTGRLVGKSCTNLNGRTFCTGMIGGIRFVVFTTGVGPVNVMEAMRDLRRFYPPIGADYALKFHGGIAGGYTPMQPGDSLLAEYACVNDWFLVTPVVVRGYILPQAGDTLASVARRYTSDESRWLQLWAANRRVFPGPGNSGEPLDPDVPLLSPWPGTTVGDRFLQNPFTVHGADGKQYRILNSCFLADPATVALGRRIIGTMSRPALSQPILDYLRGSHPGSRDSSSVFEGVETSGAGFVASPEEARRQKELSGRLLPSAVAQTDMETAYVWWAVTETRPRYQGTVDIEPNGTINVNGFPLADVLTLRTASDPPDLYGLGCDPAVPKCGAAVREEDYLHAPAAALAAAKKMYRTGIPFSALTKYQSETFARFVETGVRLWRSARP